MSFFKKLFGNKTENGSTETAPPLEENISSISSPQQRKPPSSIENMDLKNSGLSPELTQKINRMMNNQHSASTEQLEKDFERELHESFQRYFSTPGLEASFNLTESDGTVLKHHEAFDYTFAEWKKIRSKWDRRGLFYRQWDEVYLGKLKNWQVIERYNNDRLPLKGLEYQTEKINKEAFNEILLLIALAKMNRLLSNHVKAKGIIEYAYKNLPENPRVQVEYANILHQFGDANEKEFAHKLINNILEKKIEQSDSTTIGLLNFFCFSIDYIDSSIFAASFLAADNASLDDWDKMAEEYYYCPVFRYEHAVKLTQTGDSTRALAKLNSLTEEFPWYRPGVSTTIDVISQFRIQMKNPAFMETEMEKLKHYLAACDNMSH